VYAGIPMLINIANSIAANNINGNDIDFNVIIININMIPIDDEFTLLKS